jgi:hypothetical protein
MGWRELVATGVSAGVVASDRRPISGAGLCNGSTGGPLPPRMGSNPIPAPSNDPGFVMMGLCGSTRLVGPGSTFPGGGRVDELRTQGPGDDRILPARRG